MGSKREEIDSRGRKKIQCKLCNFWYHRLEVHLSKEHNMSSTEYQQRFPGAHTISESAKKNASNSAKRRKQSAHELPSVSLENALTTSEPLVFGVAKAQVVPGDELTKEQKAEVPEHDDDWEYGEKELEYMEILAAGFEDNDNVFIFGPTGAGKTSLVEQFGALTNTPTIIFQFSSPITVEDFMGCERVAIDEKTGKQVTRFVPGAFPRAWSQGYIIVFDEFTAAPSSITLRLQGVLAGGKLNLIEDGGTIVERHPRSVIVATDNTNGRGDDTGLYAGTHTINEATLDRFGTTLKYEYPSSKSEAKILVTKTNVEQSIAEKMVAIGRKVREAFDNEECYCTLSTRRLLSWAKKTVRFGDVRKACKISVLNKLSRDDERFVNDIVQRYFGGAV